MANEQHDSGIPRDKWWDWADQGAQLGFMIVAAFCAIVAIGEVASRDSFFVFLNAEANRMRKEFVDRSQDLERAAAPASPKTAVEQVMGTGALDRNQMLRDVRELQELASRVRLLAELGATYATQSLESLRNSYQEKRRADEAAKLIAERDRAAENVSELQQLVNQRASGAKDPKGMSAQGVAQEGVDILKFNLERAKADHTRLDKAVEERGKSSTTPFGFWDRVFQPSTLSSDFLLALAIMACGVMGALVAGMRSRERTSLRDFSRGMSSGFICYLGIKGGKYLFLLHAAGEAVGFNPYGSAFAGLLVGLFSQKAFETLEILFADLTTRIKQALDSGNGKPAAGEKQAPPPASGHPPVHTPEGGKPAIEAVK
jgi:hypothetical protein